MCVIVSIFFVDE